MPGEPSRLRRVALVAAHFVPSNLASVHRARLWAQHLHEFGWEPVIVTTHWRHYEEKADPELERLLDASLRIVRTPALPVRPVRLFGEVGVRSLPWHRAALARLARAGEIDFVHITVPSHFSALLGRFVHARLKLRYGIDYIDPWVHRWPGTERVLSKHWLSARLGESLEPWAVRRASLITGVAPAYFEPVLQRNPHLRTQAVTAAMPYGASERDFELARASPRRPFVFDPDDGGFHIVYAGAMLPQSHALLGQLLDGLAQWRREDPAAARVRLHFIGTGGSDLLRLAAARALDGVVTEHAARIGYVDVLTHLESAGAVLVLGSTEAHYSPSKAFQAVQSGRWVLAALHEASTALPLLEAAGAEIVCCGEGRLPGAGAFRQALQRLAARSGPPPHVDLGAYSARASARTLASALDEASARPLPA